jgi:hypothetical protein
VLPEWQNLPKNKNEAIALITFLTSPKGSSSIAGPTYEYPLNGFGTSSQLKAFGRFKPDNVSISELGETQKRANPDHGQQWDGAKNRNHKVAVNRQVTIAIAF